MEKSWQFGLRFGVHISCRNLVAFVRATLKLADNFQPNNFGCISRPNFAAKAYERSSEQLHKLPPIVAILHGALKESKIAAQIPLLTKDTNKQENKRGCDKAEQMPNPCLNNVRSCGENESRNLCITGQNPKCNPCEERLEAHYMYLSRDSSKYFGIEVT